MTGKKRMWFPGASYHITARGNRRNDIFKDEEDFELYYFNGKCTRIISEYGKQVTKDITNYLIQEGNVILSGLSKGIESIAHTVTIKNNGRTMAFLPCGIDYVYPKEHKSLINMISDFGVLLSQYQPGDKIKKSYFRERSKRIIEWSDEVILVEAWENSTVLTSIEYAHKI